MPNDIIQLPLDGPGKKGNTRSRTVGANTVHDKRYIPISEREITGVYNINSGVLSVTPAAHGTTAGYFWLINPIGSTVFIAINYIEYACAISGGNAAMPTSPRVTIERVTFTGTHSGTSITAAKRATTDATPQAILATTSTGLTLTAGAEVFAFLPVASATTGTKTVFAPAVSDWTPREDGQLILEAGEGIVARQADAGSATEWRRLDIDIQWTGFTIP